MGTNYGRMLRPQLLQILAILKAYYIQEKGLGDFSNDSESDDSSLLAKEQQFVAGLTYAYLGYLSNLWHKRYSFNYRAFIEGIAKGADITLQVPTSF